MVRPLLLNVARQGLEEAAGVRYRPSGPQAGDTLPTSPVLVCYAALLMLPDLPNRGIAEPTGGRGSDTPTAM